MSNVRRAGVVLKVSIFATGCAGIVAEFVLSTLATYLVGNAVFQWTIVMTLMLFAMGVGSRVSQFFRRRLLETFIFVEFSLSLLCASAAILAYGLSAYTSHTNLLIYGIAVFIGGLVGFEIPLVTRMNQNYEELRSNIATVMEKDYYGALLGGLFFAFFALPYLGLTYTPIILGALNFGVAILLVSVFFRLLERRKSVIAGSVVCLTALVGLAVFAKPIILYGEQMRYQDKIVYARQTAYQRIVMTQWRSYYWLYINGQEQFSTFDEEKYHEPLVHPVMTAAAQHKDVLILGGGDGLALREVWKYEAVRSVVLVDMDPQMVQMAREHPLLVDINDNSMNDARLTVYNVDAAAFLRRHDRLFDVIIIDLPDPDTIDLMHVYSTGFYRDVRNHLKTGGALVTQATSPYFSPKAFRCIVKTMRDAGLSVLPYHNQIPTMGEWGWALAVDADEMTAVQLKQRLLQEPLAAVETRFLTASVVGAMLQFGKGILDPALMADIEANTELSPVLHRYYWEGNWAVY